MKFTLEDIRSLLLEMASRLGIEIEPTRNGLPINGDSEPSNMNSDPIRWNKNSK